MADKPKTVEKDKPVEEFADLKKLMEELQTRKAAILAKTTPLRKKRDELLAKISSELKEIQAIEKQYREIEQPELANIDNQIGGLAKAMGGRAMSDNKEKLPQP